MPRSRRRRVARRMPSSVFPAEDLSRRDFCLIVACLECAAMSRNTSPPGQVEYYSFVIFWYFQFHADAGNRRLVQMTFLLFAYALNFAEFGLK
ncbi:hypothetical protein [Martelella sp. HB161492]|uniref:hypothetical protein n=1 Tax=Martelella sp. HB161492 TaxID=2720726 RepID=UPI001590B319|nr:hypothetical protein [Martelella sp. HB161492]